jgi:hypothetical protein
MIWARYLAFVGSDTSIMTTQLLSALATYSILPSGASARASGVLPSGARGNLHGSAMTIACRRCL